MDDFLRDLKVMTGHLNDFVKELPKQAGALVLESIDDNFRSESFFGTPWAPRVVQKGNDGKGILVQSGRLRRSFQLKTSGLTITIFTDTPYAQIHNEGGTISGTVEVEAYERHQYSTNNVPRPKKKNGTDDERYKKRKKVSTGTHQVRAHTRNVQQDIPQRQFMGDHPKLDTKVKALIEGGLDNIFDT
jgi:phage gpG-like protein